MIHPATIVVMNIHYGSYYIAPHTNSISNADNNHITSRTLVGFLPFVLATPAI